MARYNEVVEGMRTAMQQGNEPMAKRFAEIIENKEYEEESSAVSSALQGVAQGTTFGFGEEVGAGFRVGMEKYVEPLLYATERKFDPSVGQEDKSFGELYDQYRSGHPSGFGEHYDRALKQQREALATARREDPWTTGVSELAGGIATGGVGATTAVAGQTARQALPRLMGVGAAMGTLAGYGASEGDPIKALAFGTPEEFVEDSRKALKDAAIGGAVGAAAAPVFTAMGAGAKSIGRMFTSKNASVREQARQPIEKALREDIRDGYLNMEDARTMLEDIPGFLPADLGPAMKRITAGIARTQGPGGRIVREGLTKRNKEQWNRLYPALSEMMDSTDDWALTQRRLLDRRRIQADEMYGAAESIPIRVTPSMYKTMNMKTFKPALRVANELREMDGKKPLPDIRIGTMMSTKELDQVLQGMDKVVTTHFKHKPAVGMRSKEFRDSFKEELFTANTSLRDARRMWSGETLNNEALTKGKQIFRMDSDVAADMVREMGPSELDHFKVGTMRAIVNKLKKEKYSADTAKGLFDNPAAEEAVSIAFGNKRKFADFVRYVEGEQKLFDTFNDVVSNSATAGKLIRGSDAAADLAAAGAFASTKSLLAAGFARRGVKALSRTTQQQEAQKQVMEQQAKMLMQPPGGGVDPLRQIMQPPGGLLGPTSPAAAALSGGAAASGLLTPSTQEEYRTP